MEIRSCKKLKRFTLFLIMKPHQFFISHFALHSNASALNCVIYAANLIAVFQCIIVYRISNWPDVYLLMLEF